MSELTNAYDTEVKRIAEILHVKYWEYDGQEIPPFEDENTSPELYDQARAMIAEMAKQYESAYFINYAGTEDSEEYALWNRNCIYEMQERGLIPLT